MGKLIGSLFESITLALKLQLMTPVHETVEDRRAHGVIAKVGAPVPNDAVGGHGDATPELVAFVDDRLEQISRAVGNCPRQE